MDAGNFSKKEIRGEHDSEMKLGLTRFHFELWTKKGVSICLANLPYISTIIARWMIILTYDQSKQNLLERDQNLFISFKRS